MSRYTEAEIKDFHDNEVFHFLAASFDITVANRMMRETQDNTCLESHGKFTEVSATTLATCLDMVFVDEDYAMTDDHIDLSQPVIFVLIPVDAKKKSGARSPLMIDGYHRAYRAVKLGLKSLPAFILSSYASDKVRLR